MKKLLIIGGVIGLLAALGLWFFGRPAYRHYKERRFAQQAQRFMSARDYRNAGLSARQVLDLNSRNVEACRIMAELAELAHSPQILDWRKRIAEASPTVENKLMLARAALIVQGPPYPVAAQIVEDLGDAAKDVPEFHVVAAELALKLKKNNEAQVHFQEAARLQPTNEQHQLNLAVLRLQSPDEATATTARANLESLRASTNLGFIALRWLVADSLRRKDLTTAQNYSKQLLADKHAGTADRVQHLTILRDAKDAEYERYLAQLQNSSTNAPDMYAISTWMISHGLADNALRWLTNAPTAKRVEQPVPLAIVDCYFAKKDWDGLEQFLDQAKWNEQEYLRLAFLSRAAAEKKQALGTDARWRAAVREAGDRFGSVMALLSLANNWGRPKEKEDLLWLVTQKFPRERWALQELERMYLAAGNTRGLNKVYATRSNFDSRDFRAENDLVATWLLLKLNLPKAHQTARQLYDQHPDEPVIASTYALSLHLQGHVNNALAVLDKLKPEALQTPQVALYYGVILSTAGQTNKASTYLDLAKSATLLPEEKELLAQAATGK